MTDDDDDWEDVASPREGDYTERLKIHGGWLYRTLIEHGKGMCIAMVFVPAPEQEND